MATSKKKVFKTKPKRATKKKPSKRELERIALQKERQKAYKKQYNRIKRFMASAEKRGYQFNASAKALLKEPKRITKSTIEKLERIKPEDLYKKSSIVLEGKQYKGLAGRKEERKISAKKAAQTRKKNAKYFNQAQNILKKDTKGQIEYYRDIPKYENTFEGGVNKTATWLSVSGSRLESDMKEFKRIAQWMPIYGTLLRALDDMIEKHGFAFVASWYGGLNLPRPVEAVYYRVYAPFVLGELEKYLQIDGITPKDIVESYAQYDELDTEGYEFYLDDDPEDYNIY